jgi:hypothetical protein
VTCDQAVLIAALDAVLLDFKAAMHEKSTGSSL